MTLTANITTEAAAIYEALLCNTEGGMTKKTDGSQWGTVYLDNAIPAGMNRHSFAGYLSALERAGLYKSYEDDCFGEVRAA
jgi:hypothetical protein